MTEQEEKKYYEEKKQKVLDAIAPICEVFNIKEYDYQIQQYPLSEVLTLNGQKIGCTCNSIEAVVTEVIGYIFVKRFCTYKHLGAFQKQTLNRIKEYWIS